ncbi:MAG: hypothetical protein AB1730_16570 [Myxococcota bacterium]
MKPRQSAPAGAAALSAFARSTARLPVMDISRRWRVAGGTVHLD